MKKLLRRAAVMERIGLKKSAFHLLVQRGLFPAPVTLLGRLPAWPEETVEEWIAARPSREARPTETAR